MAQVTDSKQLPVTYQGTVYPWQCDHMGHINVMWYAHLSDQATWNLNNLMGLGPSRLRMEGSGTAAIKQTWTYMQELFAGDVVQIQTRLQTVGSKSFTFDNWLINVETTQVVAKCETIGVFMIHDGAEGRRSAPLPADVRERAEALRAAHQLLPDPTSVSL